MLGKFVMAREIEVDVTDFGRSRWLSNPPTTGAKRPTVIDVNFDPGKGHNFYKHPDQEEMVLVIAGKVERWVDRENVSLPRRLGLHSADVVHASYRCHPRNLCRIYRV
jgi:hypothetical protein